MQAISTIRCPSPGSRPVVSVSRTISRISPPPPLSVRAPALTIARQPPAAQESDDCMQPAQAQAATQAGRNDEVGTTTFLGIRHLIAQDSYEALVCHAAAPQDPLTLYQQRCGNNENIIASAFTTALEEKWDIEHDNRLSARAGKRKNPLFAARTPGKHAATSSTAAPPGAKCR